jgi:hypothetical protein
VRLQSEWVAYQYAQKRTWKRFNNCARVDGVGMCSLSDHSHVENSLGAGIRVRIKKPSDRRACLPRFADKLL